MRRRRWREPPPVQPGSGWILTYGDLVTQVLAFFILLYAFSSVDAMKFRVLLHSVQGALRSDGAPGPGWSPPVRPPAGGAAGGQLGQIRDATQQALARAGALQDISLHQETDRLIIRFPAGTLFDSGWADLKPAAVARLDSVGLVLAGISNRIRVEGHTDSVPISTAQFPSNWELSGARAASVVRYLQDFHRLDPARLEMAGLADYAPVAGNDTAAGRASNRRVDIIVLAGAG